MQNKNEETMEKKMSWIINNCLGIFIAMVSLDTG